MPLLFGKWMKMIISLKLIKWNLLRRISTVQFLVLYSSLIKNYFFFFSSSLSLLGLKSVKFPFFPSISLMFKFEKEANHHHHQNQEKKILSRSMKLNKLEKILFHFHFSINQHFFSCVSNSSSFFIYVHQKKHKIQKKISKKLIFDLSSLQLNLSSQLFIKCLFLSQSAAKDFFFSSLHCTNEQQKIFFL